MVYKIVNEETSPILLEVEGKHDYEQKKEVIKFLKEYGGAWNKTQTKFIPWHRITLIEVIEDDK